MQTFSAEECLSAVQHGAREGRLDGDVLITGGGMVGLTLGLALAQSGLETFIIDETKPAVATAPAFDGRASAIAFASCHLLKTLGLWSHLEPEAQPINDIVVSDGRLKSGAASLFLHFDHREIGDAPLGHMLENRHLRAALYAAAAAMPKLRLLAPARVGTVTRDARHATATLADGRTLRARLCIAAEGRNSPTREAAGIRTLSWRYDQTGIVATVSHEQPHGGVAHEYFLPSGPFAILPLQDNRASLVWTEQAGLARGFMALDEATFESEIARRFGPFLGATRVVGPRWSYPLGLQLAERYVLPRLALVGDAAHSIHPIAGQGFNLGLRDVAALAEVLVDAARLGLDIGAPDVLARYERWRRFDTVVLAAATDALNRLFSNNSAPLRLARDIGLALTNRFGPARRFFMRHAGGSLGDLPRLLRGEPL